MAFYPANEGREKERGRGGIDTGMERTRDAAGKGPKYFPRPRRHPTHATSLSDLPWFPRSTSSSRFPMIFFLPPHVLDVGRTVTSTGNACWTHCRRPRFTRPVGRIVTGLILHKRNLRTRCGWEGVNRCLTFHRSRGGAETGIA